jgi:hypothetical protein
MATSTLRHQEDTGNDGDSHSYGFVSRRREISLKSRLEKCSRVQHNQDAGLEHADHNFPTAVSSHSHCDRSRRMPRSRAEDIAVGVGSVPGDRRFDGCPSRCIARGALCRHRAQRRAIRRAIVVRMERHWDTD